MNYTFRLRLEATDYSGIDLILKACILTRLWEMKSTKYSNEVSTIKWAKRLEVDKTFMIVRKIKIIIFELIKNGMNINTIIIVIIIEKAKIKEKWIKTEMNWSKTCYKLL